MSSESPTSWDRLSSCVGINMDKYRSTRIYHSQWCTKKKKRMKEPVSSLNSSDNLRPSLFLFITCQLSTIRMACVCINLNLIFLMMTLIMITSIRPVASSCKLLVYYTKCKLTSCNMKSNIVFYYRPIRSTNFFFWTWSFCIIWSFVWTRSFFWTISFFWTRSFFRSRSLLRSLLRIMSLMRTTRPLMRTRYLLWTTFFAKPRFLARVAALSTTEEIEYNTLYQLLISFAQYEVKCDYIRRQCIRSKDGAGGRRDRGLYGGRNVSGARMWL